MIFHSHASTGDPNAPGTTNLEQLVRLDFTTRLYNLDISYNAIRGSLSYLLCQKFPFLESLKLRGCYLNDEIVRILAEASVENNLPKLQHLNIPDNGNTSLDHLSDSTSKWVQIRRLQVDWTDVFSRKEIFVP